MTLIGRHLLLLGLTPLICGQAAATCYGNACPEQHDTATAQGRLGDSLSAGNVASECSNKSYKAPEPVRACILKGVASIGLHLLHDLHGAAAAGVLDWPCLCPDWH